MFDRFETYRPLLTPAGREQLARSVRAFRETYGEDWMAEFKRHNAKYVMVVDLCANHEFEGAYEELRSSIVRDVEAEPNFIKQQALMVVVNTFFKGAAGDLRELHRVLKAEIDKPRF